MSEVSRFILYIYLPLLKEMHLDDSSGQVPSDSEE
jgi:hypothetical protein